MSDQQQMQGSWLVQRLNKPRPAHHILGTDNPFAFGGGLVNGGLSGEAMDLLRPIFSFDYMGAAEFELGAVPEALNRLAKAKRLAHSTVDVDLAGVPLPWSARKDEPKIGRGTAPVYVLSQAAHVDEVHRRIAAWATEPYGRTLKESTNLNRALRPSDDSDRRTCGWLELDNGFFFFTDAEMWTSTCAVFGVEAEAVEAA